MKKASGYKLLPGMEVIGLSLYVPKEKTLVIADLHLGYEEELRSMGFMLPKFQYKEIVSYLGKIFGFLGETKLERIIINGDLKHGFGGISGQEWGEVNGLLDFLSMHCREVVLVRGNHDGILAPIVKRRKIDLVDYFFLPEEGIYVCHGHKINKDSFLAEAKTVVVAHDHFALSLAGDIRTEKIKCFLAGKWNGKDLIGMPSLNFISEGCDVLSEGSLSPFMKQDMGGFNVFGVEGFEVLSFGRLSAIRKVLGKK